MLVKIVVRKKTIGIDLLLVWLNILSVTCMHNELLISNRASFDFFNEKPLNY